MKDYVNKSFQLQPQLIEFHIGSGDNEENEILTVWPIEETKNKKTSKPVF